MLSLAPLSKGPTPLKVFPEGGKTTGSMSWHVEFLEDKKKMGRWWQEKNQGNKWLPQGISLSSKPGMNKYRKQ